MPIPPETVHQNLRLCCCQAILLSSCNVYEAIPPAVRDLHVSREQLGCITELQTSDFHEVERSPMSKTSLPKEHALWSPRLHTDDDDDDDDEQSWLYVCSWTCCQSWSQVQTMNEQNSAMSCWHRNSHSLRGPRNFNGCRKTLTRLVVQCYCGTDFSL